MKKILISFAIFVNCLFASEINWINDFDKAVELSKLDNKPIIMLIDRKYCPYCVLLKRDVLGSSSISTFIKDNFIALKVDQNDKTYPKDFQVRGTPTTFFVDKTGESYTSPIVGYATQEKYLKYLKYVYKKWETNFSNI